MRKFIWMLIVAAIVGAVVLGVAKTDIILYIADFLKNMSIWILGIVKEIADDLNEYFASHTPNNEALAFVPFK